MFQDNDSAPSLMSHPELREPLVIKPPRDQHLISLANARSSRRLQGTTVIIQSPTINDPACTLLPRPNPDGSECEI